MVNSPTPTPTQIRHPAHKQLMSHTQDTCCIYMSDSHDLSWSSISCLSLMSTLHNISVTACDFVWHSSDVSRKQHGKLFCGWSLNSLFCSICCLFCCISTSALRVSSVTPLNFKEIKSNKKMSHTNKHRVTVDQLLHHSALTLITEHALYFRQPLSNIQLFKIGCWFTSAQEFVVIM